MGQDKGEHVKRIINNDERFIKKGAEKKGERKKNIIKSWIFNVLDHYFRAKVKFS